MSRGNALLRIAAATVVAMILALGIALYLLLRELDAMWKPSEDEVARATSPSQAIDAVLTEANGGATTSFAYLIYLVPKGEKPQGGHVARIYAARRSEFAYGVNLKWPERSRLVVEYLTERYSSIETPVKAIGGEDVTVALRNGVLDASTPAGGMLYNLRK